MNEKTKKVILAAVFVVLTFFICFAVNYISVSSAASWLYLENKYIITEMSVGQRGFILAGSVAAEAAVIKYSLK